MTINRRPRTSIGFSVLCPGADSALTLGTCGSFFNLTAGAWAISYNVKFNDNLENVYFGGAGEDTRVFYIYRNVDGTVDGSTRIQLTDSAGNVRQINVSSGLNAHRWYNIIINSSGSGDSNIAMYVNGTSKTVASETNDAGYSPDGAFSLKFGEALTDTTGSFNVSRPVFYNRALTTTEITNISQSDEYPTDYIAAFMMNQPNIGLNE